MVFERFWFVCSFIALPTAFTNGVGFKGVFVLWGWQVTSRDWFVRLYPPTLFGCVILLFKKINCESSEY